MNVGILSEKMCPGLKSLGITVLQRLSNCSLVVIGKNLNQSANLYLFLLKISASELK